jgi:uncharacterized repeat protein (TIGR01451 family)
VTASGADANSGAPVAVTGYPPSVLVAPAALLRASADALPALIREGETFGVALTISNTGGAGAGGLGPSLVFNNLVRAGVVSGPSPAGPVTIMGGGMETFVWQVQAREAGSLTISLSGTGTDLLNLFPAGAGVSATLTVSPLLVATASASPAGVKAGDAVRLLVTVSNTGTITATVVSASVSASDPALAAAGGAGPAVPVVLGPGASTVLAWDFTAHGQGSLVLTATVTGIAGGVPVGARASGSVAVSLRFPGESQVVYPNPVRGDRLNLALKLDPRVESVQVEVYNIAFERIWRREWSRAEAPYGDLVIDGVRRWAPGLYILRAKGRLTGGGEQAFPSAKVVVKR